MSTALAYDPVRRPVARPDPIAPAPAATPRRVAVPARAAARPRVLVAAALVGAAASIVGAQLVLSISTAQSAYELATLQQTSTGLARDQAAQQEALRALAAPQRLAARAVALGMVPDDAPAYLDARTGRVLGGTRPAAADAGVAVAR